ncbi:ATP-grasp domain-containing protein [Candidatus Woesearchaeota archaeon]|nr:ATP-grasp domain-containing protein [Candidatus Woesearchaeota archaeon]
MNEMTTQKELCATKKNLVVGFIYTARKLGKEENLFLELAKKKGIDLVMINLYARFDVNAFESKIKQCDIIYNNSAEECVIEPLKTIEELGKKVIDSSKLYYYTEDKWMFYLKCKENKIPTPETILMSNNLTLARAELRKFGKWPVVIKRIYGTNGLFVEKANTMKEALAIMKKFWRQDYNRLPLIAQEYIKSYSYRVTLINQKIVQTAVKVSNSWKCTGVYGRKIEKFHVDKVLRKLVKRVSRATKINICGIDLLKRDGQWVVLEVNSDPGLDFIDEEHEKLVGLVLDFVKHYSKKSKRKKTKRKKPLNYELSKYFLHKKLLHDELSRKISSKRNLYRCLSRKLTHKKVLHKRLSKRISHKKIVHRRLSRKISSKRIVHKRLHSKITNKRKLYKKLNKKVKKK